MTITNFNRRPSKGQLRKFAHLQKNAVKQTGADPIDEALARAIESVYAPAPPSEGWQATVCIVAVCACIGFIFWCILK